MSQLPAWASRVLNGRKPLSPYGQVTPNAERMALWEGIKKRFENQWFEIEPDKWAVPSEHSEYLHLERSGYMYSGCEYVKSGILECAVSIAFEIGTKKSPVGVGDAIKKLDELNSAISHRAEELSNLFEQREQLMTQWMLSDEWLISGESATDSLDSFDFFDALELLLQRQPYFEWGHVADEKVAAFLNQKWQSRTSPDWKGLLAVIAERLPRQVTPTTAADAAAISTRKSKQRDANTSQWSSWALRLIGSLDGHAGNGVSRGFFLNCLSASDIASLARVTLDSPADAFSNDQMKMLIRRYKNRKAE